jgi:3',5'-nucleoside bisphosphate phosphatase
MADFRADLHCHSTCSDGTETPERLVQLAVEAGLQGLSITDHDSIDAYQQIE